MKKLTAIHIIVPCLTFVLAACSDSLDLTDDPIGAAGVAGGGAGGTGGADPIGEPDAGEGGEGGSSGSGATGGSSGSGPAGGATCEDELRNGDEAGVDCGGSDCAPCVPCPCAASDALQALDCGVNPNAGGIWGNPDNPTWLSTTGDAVAFDWCHTDNVCRAYYWTAAGGVRELSVPGGGSALGMTADGSRVLVAPRQSLGTELLLFDASGVSTPTGLPAGTRALLSADGVVVSVIATEAGENTLMRRTQTGELEELGALPFDATYAILTGVTPDGSAVVGYGYYPSSVPFRWSVADGLVIGLGDAPAPADNVSITSLSPDGSTLSGVTAAGVIPTSVFRWTAAGGLTTLAPAISLSAPFINPMITATSQNGDVIAGSTQSAEDMFSAFRWTEASGVTALTPGAQSVLSLMNNDGSVIVGQLNASNDAPFVWTEADGPRNINAVLAAAGVDLTGWQVHDPLALSDDGRVIAGVGRCGGVETVYRLVLPE